MTAQLHQVFDPLKVQGIRQRLAEVDDGFIALPGNLMAILQLAAAVTDVPPEDIVSASRHPSVCWVRFAVIHAAASGGKRKLSAIGRALGGRDHSTIAYGLGRARHLAASDPAFRHLCEMLQAVSHAPEPAPAPAQNLAETLITGDRDLFPPGPLFQFGEQREALLA